MHNRLNRLASAKGFRTQKFNTATHGLSSLRYTGTKALNSLKNAPPFNDVTNKKHPKRLFSNLAYESYQKKPL